MQNFENLTEKQVESREIFDGYIMHVFKDTVELPNGKLAPREYMRHVGAVCASCRCSMTAAFFWSGSSAIRSARF